MRTTIIHWGRNAGAVLVSGLLIVSGYVVNNASVLKSKIAESATSTNTSGFMWSDTVGWISMNSASDGSSVSYGVSVDTSNFAAGGVGAFSGYAWSENVGWITFDAAQAGTPPGAPSHMAQVEWNTGKVTGWARALAGVGRTDGWDGWIKFSKDPGDVGPDYGATINKTTGTMTGYAWGSDVVGWIDVGAGLKPAKVNINQCSGINESGTPPNCTCVFGYTRNAMTGICESAMDSCGINESGTPPNCTCVFGYTRNAMTGICESAPSSCEAGYVGAPPNCSKVGDGACDASKGETVFNSPIDCGPKGVKQF